MEGILWIKPRAGRARLLKKWQKRYFVLTSDGHMKEFVVQTKQPPGSATSSASGMEFVSQFHLQEAQISKVSFALVGKKHVFQVTKPATSDTAALRMLYAAKNAESCKKWIHALRQTIVLIDVACASTPVGNCATTPTFHALDELRQRSDALDGGRDLMVTSSGAISGTHGFLPVSPPPVLVLPTDRVERKRRATLTHVQVTSHGHGDHTDCEVHATTMESELAECVVTHHSELTHLLDKLQWSQQNRVIKLKTTYLTASSSSSSPSSAKKIVRGSLLVSINGIALQTLEPDEVRNLLCSKASLPVKCGFYVAPRKKGSVLMSLCGCLSSQLDSLNERARCRSTCSEDLSIDATTTNTELSPLSSPQQLQPWKRQRVELEGDLLTFSSEKTPSRPQSAAAQVGGSTALGSSDGVNSTSHLVPLSNCTIKTVHELVADNRKFCLALSIRSSYSILIQAGCFVEMMQWQQAIERGIRFSRVETTLASNSLTTDELQALESHDEMISSVGMEALLQASAVNMRCNQVRKRRKNKGSFISNGTTSASDEEEWGDQYGEQVPTHPEEEEDHDEQEQDEVNVSDTSKSLEDSRSSMEQMEEEETAYLLVFLQHKGRFVEALQLLCSSSANRVVYWKKLFAYALPAGDVDPERLERLLQTPLEQEDVIQVEKDIPRTAQWLDGCVGAPRLDKVACMVRLEALEQVLHAFLSIAYSTKHKHASEETPRAKPLKEADDGSIHPRSNFYMQGMNGIAFVLLEVLQNDRHAALAFFHGIVSSILPHVFGIFDDTTEHCDLFYSLMSIGSVLQQIVQWHLPNFHAKLEQGGLPVAFIAYKWFPTLFSDVSLTFQETQLRFDTLLVIWDVCLLMGVEGIFTVALALFCLAEKAVLELSDKLTNVEDISKTLGQVFSMVQPSELILSVCEVIELCDHAVLMKLRNGHRRCLHHTRATAAAGNGMQAAALETPRALASNGTTGSSVTSLTIRDLDSGKVFLVSKSGNTLIPQ